MIKTGPVVNGRISEPAVLTRQTRKTRALFSAGSSEIYPYRACTPTDRTFLAQVTKPQVLVNAGVPSGSVFVLLSSNQGRALAFHNSAIDNNVRDILAARNVIHDIEHDLLKHRTQSSGTGAFRNRLQR